MDKRTAANMVTANPQDAPLALVEPYSQPARPKKSVLIPEKAAHCGISSMLVSLYWVCPKCGRDRGEPFDTYSYDRRARLMVHGWRNQCGHVDLYAEVRDEAAGLP